MKIHNIEKIEINEQTLPVISKLAECIPGGFFIYRADGEQELIYFNSRVPQIYGCDSNEEFKALVHNSFKGIVHPDDYEKIENNIKDQIDKSNDKVDHVKYRFVRKDGSVGMMDDYGHYSYSKSYGNIYYVFVQDISGEYEKELRQEERSSEIINEMIGGESTYIVDLENDSFQIIQRNRYLEANYSKFEKYSESILRYIDKDVYGPDKKRVYNALNLEGLKKILKDHNEVTKIYRDVSSGVSQWYKVRIVKINDNKIVMGFVDFDNAYYDNLIRDKIDSDYFGMYVADLDAQIMKIIKSSPFYKTQHEGSTIPYMPSLLGFAKLNSGEAGKFFSNLTDINYINRVFANENKISFTYRSPVAGKNKWVSADCTILSRHEDGTPQHFALGFRLVDALASERNDLQEKIKAIKAVMETLTEDFGCVNYVEFKENKKDDVCVPYRSSNLLKRLIPGWEKELYFHNKINILYEQLVYKPEADEFYKNVCRERILKELENKDIYFVNFKAYFDGEIKYYQAKFSAIRDDGKLVGMVAGIHSVDDLVKKELATQAKLEEALKAAEIANRSKTKFLFNMSHDIRTPMNAILGFTNMAKKNADDKEKILDYIEKIEISGQQLLTLINQILEMSRIDSGKIDIEENKINISVENTSMVTVFSEQARENGLIFNHSMNNIEHNYVIADRAKVSSIMLNIVGNALKYTPRGGTINFDLTELPSKKEGYASFVLVVEDTGIGMSEEYLKVLFEPFTREKNSTISKIQGTGLGMPIVKELIRIMGGEIKVQSEIGKGTRFDIYLDFKIDEKPTLEAKAKAKRTKLSYAGMKVLLVDDNDLNREIAMDILQEAGFVVEDVDDGKKAVDAVKEKGEDYYQFVLMDIQMPVMDGYEATRKIRKLYPDGKLPIIALSANAFAEDRAASLAAGMNDHVAKPIKIFDLLDCLQKYLK